MLSFFFLSVVHLLGLTFRKSTSWSCFKSKLAPFGNHIDIQVILDTL